METLNGGLGWMLGRLRDETVRLKEYNRRFEVTSYKHRKVLRLIFCCYSMIEQQKEEEEAHQLPSVFR